jgi:hypothetical protein
MTAELSVQILIMLFISLNVLGVIVTLMKGDGGKLKMMMVRQLSDKIEKFNKINTVDISLVGIESRRKQDKIVCITVVIITVLFSVAGIVTAIMKFGSILGGK